MNEQDDKKNSPLPKRTLKETDSGLGKLLESMNRETNPLGPLGNPGKSKHHKKSHDLNVQKPTGFQSQARKMTGKARGNRGR